MGFTLLLLLTAAAPPSGVATPELSASSDREPLTLWSAANRSLPWLRLLSAQPRETAEGTRNLQLQNQRTGVTCSMRILQVKPVPDPRMIAAASGPHPDPIVRSSLSPCVE